MGTTSCSESWRSACQQTRCLCAVHACACTALAAGTAPPPARDVAPVLLRAPARAPPSRGSRLPGRQLAPPRAAWPPAHPSVWPAPTRLRWPRQSRRRSWLRCCSRTSRWSGNSPTGASWPCALGRSWLQGASSGRRRRPAAAAERSAAAREPERGCCRRRACLPTGSRPCHPKQQAQDCRWQCERHCMQLCVPLLTLSLTCLPHLLTELTILLMLLRAASSHDSTFSPSYYL